MIHTTITHRVTFKYEVTLATFDGRYDREIDVAGTYSVNVAGDPADWQIETCSANLDRDQWSALEDAIAGLIDGDVADLDCDDSIQVAA